MAKAKVRAKAPAKKQKSKPAKPAAKKKSKATPAAKSKPAKPAAKQKSKAKPAAKSKAKPAAKSKSKSKPAAAARVRTPKAPPVVIPTDIDELSRAWNTAGRAFYADYSERLARYFGDDDDDVDLEVEDPRPEAMGQAVLAHVINFGARGDYERSRALFDPAYAPIFPAIEESDRSLQFVTILGPDELLVRRGSAWEQDGVTFHLKDGTATVIDDVLGVARSRNRDHLVLARAAGLEIRDARAGIAGLEGPPTATIPWPEKTIFRPVGLADSIPWEPDAEPFAVEQLGISDDGMRVVVSCYRQGILLASRQPFETPWHLLWPDARERYAAPEDEQDAEPPAAGDMTHVAMSPDGTRLAYGNQGAGHFLAELDDAGNPTWYATVGHVSEYPHHAWFSDDGRYVALNSCHMYNGATIAFDWKGNRGADLGTYEEHAAAPIIDGGLRVYAAAWVPKRTLEAIVGGPAEADGAFVLAGSGAMRICTPSGEVVAVQGFGSSAGSMDYCPETNQLALASYSGMIHVYDPDRAEEPGRIDGWRARHERFRWLLWEHLPNGPVRW